MNATQVIRLLVFYLLSGCALSAYGQGDDWSLSKDKNGIQIFTRKVEGSPIKEPKSNKAKTF